MSKEILWVLLPISGFLSQLGGTFNKAWRRFGIPSVVCAGAIIFCGWSWWLILLWACIHGATRLPFTLIGDGINESIWNWIWLVVYSAILNVCGFASFLAYGNLPLFFLSAIVPYIAILGYSVLSNVKVTSRIFPWKYCEAVIWGMAMVPVCIVLSNS